MVWRLNTDEWSMKKMYKLWIFLMMFKLQEIGPNLTTNSSISNSKSSRSSKIGIQIITALLVFTRLNPSSLTYLFTNSLQKKRSLVFEDDKGSGVASSMICWRRGVLRSMKGWIHREFDSHNSFMWCQRDWGHDA